MISLTPDVVGKTTVTITINNKTFQVNINTLGVDVPNSLLLSTKQKKQITVKGINGILPIHRLSVYLKMERFMPKRQEMQF